MQIHDQHFSNFTAAAPKSKSAVALDDPAFAAEFLRNGCFFSVNAVASTDSDLVIGWGPWHRSAHANASANVCSLFTPDFYMTDEAPWRSPAKFQFMSRAIFISHVLPQLKKEVNFHFSQPFQWLEPIFSDFEKQIEKIRQAFKKSGLVKAVPIVHALSHEPMTHLRLVAILGRMSEAPSSLVPHGFWDESTGEGLLGVTPEHLFSMEADKTLVTMALAGTSTDREGLLMDPKERREHQIVIDDLTERLRPFGKVSVGGTFVAELPTLCHLKTPISVLLSSRRLDFESIARSLHPTPALGIAPRSFDFQNMKQWDDIALRGRYGAPFGLCLRTKEIEIRDCLVAIRNVQWRRNQPLTLGSGCGFIQESVTEREWSELSLKRESVQKVLSL